MRTTAAICKFLIKSFYPGRTGHTHDTGVPLRRYLKAYISNTAGWPRRICILKVVLD